MDGLTDGRTERRNRDGGRRRGKGDSSAGGSSGSPQPAPSGDTESVSRIEDRELGFSAAVPRTGSFKHSHGDGKNLLLFNHISFQNVGGRGSRMPSSTFFLSPVWELFVRLGLTPTQHNVREKGVKRDTGAAGGNSDRIRASEGSEALQGFLR